jgi:tetratricopeptide (TPR) repeat protein
MKTAFAFALFLLVFAGSWNSACGGSDSSETWFQQAQQAYEGGRFEEAAQLYQRILSQGNASAEVFFNLGNAHYRSGAMGPAIANYRRAQYLRPRHPDIRANLAIAQRQTGALNPEETAWMKTFGRVSRSEWVNVGLLGYWLAGGAGVIYLLIQRKRAWLRLSFLGLAMALAGGMGWQYWHGLERHPEVVILRSGVQSLFAPLDGAMPHFPAPEGSIVRLREQSGRWLKIEAGRQEGWLLADTCDQLSQR